MSQGVSPGKRSIRVDDNIGLHGFKYRCSFKCVENVANQRHMHAYTLNMALNCFHLGLYDFIRVVRAWIFWIIFNVRPIESFIQDSQA